MFTGFDISTIQDAKLGSTQINEIWYGNTKLWPVNSYKRKYFTIEMEESGDIIYYFPLWPDDDYIQHVYVMLDCDLYYSTDDGLTWTQAQIPERNVGYITINANAGDIINFKADNYRWRSAYPPTNPYTPDIGPDGSVITEISCCKIKSTARHKVYGNIMSLLYGDNFYSQNEFIKVWYKTDFPTACFPVGFKCMFEDSTGLTDTENLIIPIDNLRSYLDQHTRHTITYRKMFYNCTNLLKAPELPATTLTEDCYSKMFMLCTILTKAPTILPATTLAKECYNTMFYECFSLTTAPELPATTLADYCYYQMFGACTSLNYIKCLATDISAGNCLTSWVNGVSSTGTFVRDASMTSWTTGVSGIPSGWTIDPPISHDYSRDYLTFEAIQPTTFTFSTNNLEYSLDDGSTWTTLTAGTATSSLAAGDKILWKQTGLTPTSSSGIGTFSATGNFKAYGNVMSLYYGDNFVGQTSLSGKDYAFAKLFYRNNYLIDALNLVLSATTLVGRCYYQMFYNCTSLTTAPELPATTLATYCYMGMFQNCSSLTTAPELPATTLDSYCYMRMFQGCSVLNYIKCLATDISASSCTNNWVNSVSSTGTFVKAASMSSWSTGTSGIPSGWTTINN